MLALDRVAGRLARLPGAPGCLVARGTRLGAIAFYHVNPSCRDIPACRDEINQEDMAAKGEFFRSYHLPVLSAEQNDSKSEEKKVIDESQAENRPVPVQEAEKKDGKKFPWSPVMFVVLSSRPGGGGTPL